MKKVLLFTALLTTASVWVAAQSVLWSETFNGGSTGWTVKTTQCGTLSNIGPHIGRWTLTQATLNGTPIPNLNGEFSVNTAVDYSLFFSDGTNRAQVQARYTLAANVFTSNLNNEVIPLADTNYFYNPVNRQTIFYTNLNMNDTAYNEWGKTFMGIGTPSFVISGSTLTITSSDNSVQLVFSKASDCGTLWWWSPNGSVRSGALWNAATGEVTINSPTNTNGAMVFNADFYTTQGLSSNIPTGPPPYPQYTSELISPRIDLSGVTSAVSISFFQVVRFLNPSSDGPTGLRTSISYSTDDGVTWSDPLNVNQGVAVNSPPLQAQRIFNLPGIQGSANVRIKFIWSADFYYWAIDDIQLLEPPRYEMRVNTNFFAITPNFATPISQVEPYHFLADVENVGSATSTNVNLNLTIVKNQTTDTVYNGNVFYGDVPAGVLAENYIFPTSMDPNRLSIGQFNATYLLTLDSTDFLPSNNVINWNFVVTDSLFAKESGRAGTVRYSPAAQPSFTYGNIFHVVNGTGLYARYITFQVTNPEELEGRSVTTLLYRWRNENGNNLAEPAEYGNAPIAFNVYTFTGQESGSELIRVPVDNEGNPVPLESGWNYIAAVEYSTEDNQRLYFGGNDRLDYNAMRFLYDSLQKPRFHTALIVGSGGNPSFNLFGFSPGNTQTPVIRLSIGDNPDYNGPAFLSSGVNNVLSAEALDIFPVPANDIVNLRLNLDEAQNIQLAIFNANGQLLENRRFDNLSKETIQMSVKDLVPGVYYVKMSTPKGFRVGRIVVSR